MSKHSDCGKIGSATRANRTKKSVGSQTRRLGFESLELRRLLSTVAAPTAVAFQPSTGQGTSTLTSANNSSTSKELNFVVSGVTAGDTVNLYADGDTTAIATGTVGSTATTITLTTNGTSKLSDGSHIFTAKQTSSGTTSSSSPGLSLHVFASLAMTSVTATSATVGHVFTYTVQTNAPSGVGDTVTITAGATLPGNMQFDGTDAFTWTPTSDEVGVTQSFAATLTDTAGNSTVGTVFVAVAATSGVSVLSPPTNIAIGSPVLVALNSADTGTPTFSVTTSNSSLLTATLMPQTNQVLKIVTDQGEMDFQLFNNYTPKTVAHFLSLVNSNTYSNTTFYRIIQNFMNQGGAGSSGSGSSIPDELNADLRFTSSGLLAMANNGVDGNSSEFFITNPNDMSDGFLDFRYTIFGKLIAGDNVRQAIAATPVTTGSSGENSQPLTAPKILSMSVTTETSDRVLLLKAATGATGSYTVTVSDGLSGTQTFTITVGTNSYDPPNPWVQPINGDDQIQAAANTAVTFTPQGQSADGTAVQVKVQLFRAVPSVSGAYVDDSYTGTSPPADTTNPNMTLVKNGSSYTVTPTTGYYGVQVLEVTGQSATAASWDSSANVGPAYRAFVPVFVAPPAPQIASISVGGQTISGSTFANNATTATEFSFKISGAISGAAVSVFLDGGATAIATGTVASGATTITVTTNGTTKIADGNHQFTVKQTLATSAITLYADWSTGSSGLFPGTQFPIPANSVASAASAGTALTIGLGALAPPITTAQVGVLYTYIVQTNAPSGDTVTVTPGSMPAGMQFNGSNTFTWTPTNAQLNTTPAFSVQISDSQGRTAAIGPVNISVIIGLALVQVPVNSKLGGNVTVSFSGSQVVVYDNVAKAILSKATFKSTDAISVDLPAGQANSVSVVLPAVASAAIPREVLVQGVFGSTTNQVTMVGSAGANTFALAGDTVTANGLAMQFATVQKLTLNGGGGSDYYRLDSSAAPVSIVDVGGYNTLDFSHDTAGVAVNLNLNKGQAQSIAPWGNTLSINGTVNYLIGSQFADVLTGGSAATTEIRGGLGNNTITGGSGDNIILGGGGNSTITGGHGRNLIIGCAGDCTIYAIGAQNMVFGGMTNYNSNDQALLNLLAQGPFFSFGYSMRRAMASVAAKTALQSSMFAFQDVGAHDTIYGSSNINNLLMLGKYCTLKS